MIQRRLQSIHQCLGALELCLLTLLIINSLRLPAFHYRPDTSINMFQCHCFGCLWCCVVLGLVLPVVWCLLKASLTHFRATFKAIVETVVRLLGGCLGITINRPLLTLDNDQKHDQDMTDLLNNLKESLKESRRIHQHNWPTITDQIVFFFFKSIFKLYSACSGLQVNTKEITSQLWIQHQSRAIFNPVRFRKPYRGVSSILVTNKLRFSRN